MTTKALEDIIGTFNKRFKAAQPPHPCFSGAIKGSKADCATVSGHVLPPHGTSSSPSWVVSRIDNGCQVRTPDDYDVVIAVGINYGQDASIPSIYDKTKMRPHLKEAFDLLTKNAKAECNYGAIPEPDNYHLVAFNFFPWLTSNPWSELGVNCIEEALLIYCLGYPKIFDPLESLLSSIGIGQGKVVWIVFHGANNAVAALGAAFCQTLNPVKRPDVLFCDNLAWSVRNNSVVLCR
jgi:hypothetical protein